MTSSSEKRNGIISKREEYNPGLIAGLTIFAFIVGMAFAFLICYIHRIRQSMDRDNLGSKSRNESPTILPFLAPTRANLTTQNSQNPPPQGVIPWEADYHGERRDRIVDLAGPSAARSRWRQQFSRAMLPNPRSATHSTRSGTVVTGSNYSDETPRSPTTLLSPSGMTLSSHFYAPSTMPSIGRPRTRDRYSMLTD